MHITVAANVYCKEQDTEKCLVCVKKLVQTLVYMGYAICTLYTYVWSAILYLWKSLCMIVFVLNGRVNKFSWMTHKNILMPIPSNG